MNCERIKPLLVPFLESQLKGQDQSMVEVHLQTCASCQNEKALLEKTWSMLDGVKAPELSHNFTSKVMARIHEQSQKKPEINFDLSDVNDRILLGVMATSILALCLIGVVYLICKKSPLPIQPTAEILSQPKVIYANKDIVPAPAEVKAIRVITTSPIKEFVLPVKKEVSDEDIIRNLDTYQHSDFYKNYPLIKDFDEVESLAAKGPGL